MKSTSNNSEEKQKEEKEFRTSWIYEFFLAIHQNHKENSEHNFKDSKLKKHAYNLWIRYKEDRNFVMENQKEIRDQINRKDEKLKNEIKKTQEDLDDIKRKGILSIGIYTIGLAMISSLVVNLSQLKGSFGFGEMIGVIFAVGLVIFGFAAGLFCMIWRKTKTK